MNESYVKVGYNASPSEYYDWTLYKLSKIYSKLQEKINFQTKRKRNARYVDGIVYNNAVRKISFIRRVLKNKYQTSRTNSLAREGFSKLAKAEESLHA